MLYKTSLKCLVHICFAVWSITYGLSITNRDGIEFYIFKYKTLKKKEHNIIHLIIYFN